MYISYTGTCKCTCTYTYIIFSIHVLSADPGLSQGRSGAWDHRRCGTMCPATHLANASHSASQATETYFCGVFKHVQRFAAATKPQHAICQLSKLSKPFPFKAFKGANCQPSKLFKRFRMPFGSLPKPVRPPHFAFQAFKGANAGLQNSSNAARSFFGSLYRPPHFVLRRSKLPICSSQNSANASGGLSAAFPSQSGHRTLF